MPGYLSGIGQRRGIPGHFCMQAVFVRHSGGIFVCRTGIKRILRYLVYLDQFCGGRGVVRICFPFVHEKGTCKEDCCHGIEEMRHSKYAQFKTTNTL